MTSSGAVGAGKKRIRTKILVILLSLLLFSGFSLATTFAVCDMVFARPEQNDLYHSVTMPVPAKLDMCQTEFISSGRKLCATTVYASEPQGVVVIAHGLTGDRRSHLAEALYFLENHFSVFLFDGTGTGESEGKSAVGVQQMTLDLDAALRHLAKDASLSELPILIYGHSMGAHAAAVVAAEHEDVKGVVCISGFDSPMQLMRDSASKRVGVLAVTGYPFISLRNLMLFGDRADQSAVSAINSASASFFIVQGAKDAVIHRDNSLYGCRDRIVNPNVTYLYLDGPQNNGHSDAWLSADALSYRKSVAKEFPIRSTHSLKASAEDALTQYYTSVDAQRLYDINTEFLSEVLRFFLRVTEA